MEAPPATTPSPIRLIRVPESFANLESDLFQSLGATVTRKLGRNYRLVRLTDPTQAPPPDLAGFISWNLPVHHSWPCNPRNTDGFIERAAQALAAKFSASNPQTVLVGALDPGSPNRYYRSLASNLRGRLLQLFPDHCSRLREATDQNPSLPTLFCHVGNEGLFCGLQSPRQSGGFHPGGTRFIRQSDAQTISRAGAKLAEALHHLQLHQSPPAAGSHWLELGASPGGMTTELLRRNYRVTAIDRAPLDPRLTGTSNALTTIIADAASFHPAPGTSYDALLCDMNGSALDSIRQVLRLAKFLHPGAPAIFTLKLPGANTLDEINQLSRAVIRTAAAGGLNLIAKVHLTYNRHEFTLFLQPSSGS